MPIGTYTPPPGKSITQFFLLFFLYIFFHFRCILLQISHQKCFFISISIPGRSGVKQNIILPVQLPVCRSIFATFYFEIAVKSSKSQIFKKFQLEHALTL